MNNTISSKILSVVFVVLALCFATAMYVVAWTEPTAGPPGGNVAAPINIGDVTQYKSGALGVGGVFETDSATHLAILSGTVGIGTTTPEAKLHIDVTNSGDSAIRITNSGLLHLDGDVVGSGSSDFAMYASQDDIYFVEPEEPGFQFMVIDDGVGTANINLLPGGSGNVGIGTTQPTTVANPNNHATGNLDVNDVWLRDAKGGNGAWASEVGGFNPDPYKGQESITFPNGLILKHGYVVESGSPTVVNFKSDFSEKLVSVTVTAKKSATEFTNDETQVFNTTKGGFGIYGTWAPQDLNGFYWQAWGY